MSRHLAVALPIVLLFATSAWVEPLQPRLSAGLPQWQWSGPSNQALTVRIDLVRADVKIVASSDDMVSVRIVTEGTTEDAARVWIDVAQKDGSYVLSDRYPQRSPWAMLPECLPPSDERGDFWVVSTRFKVIIAAPRGTHPLVTLKSGTVRDMR